MGSNASRMATAKDASCKVLLCHNTRMITAHGAGLSRTFDQDHPLSSIMAKGLLDRGQQWEVSAPSHVDSRSDAEEEAVNPFKPRTVYPMKIMRSKLQVCRVPVLAEMIRLRYAEW